MEEVVILQDGRIGLRKTIMLGILFILVTLVAISYIINSNNLTLQIVMTLLSIFCFGIFGNSLLANFRKIIISQDSITISSLLGFSTISVEEIKSIKIEFVEYVDGFNRMRFLSIFSRADSLPTTFTYEIETKEHLIYDTLANIEQTEVVDLVSQIQRITGSEPQTNQIDEVDQRGNQFYFSL